jgi:hypothetical protein
MPLTQWLPLLQESLRVLKPQSWLEIQELGMPHISHPTPWIWLALLGRANGVEPFPGHAVDKWLEQVGGVHIRSHDHYIHRTPDPNTSARMLIREGIALFEMCRAALVEQQIATVMACEQEVQRMQENMFIPNRTDALSIHTTLCHKPTI